MASEQKTELVKKYKLTEKELGRECSKDHSLDIGEFISWKDVGPRLAEVDNEDVVAIDKDGRDEADKRRLLINMWKKRNGSNATYDAMITAMLKARTRSEAERVCKMLSPANPGGPLGPRGV